MSKTKIFQSLRPARLVFVQPDVQGSPEQRAEKSDDKRPDFMKLTDKTQQTQTDLDQLLSQIKEPKKRQNFVELSQSAGQEADKGLQNLERKQTEQMLADKGQLDSLANNPRVQSLVERGRMDPKLKEQLPQIQELIQKNLEQAKSLLADKKELSPADLQQLVNLTLGELHGLHGEAAKIYRGDIFEKIGQELAKSQLSPEQRSDVLEKALALQSAPCDSVKTSLWKSMRAAEKDLPLGSPAERKKIEDLMAKGETVDFGKEPLKIGGQEFKVGKAKVLVGGQMAEVDPGNMKTFKLKDVALLSDGRAVGRMENGCRSNFMILEPVKVEDPKPDEVERPMQGEAGRAGQIRPEDLKVLDDWDEVRPGNSYPDQPMQGGAGQEAMPEKREFQGWKYASPERADTLRKKFPEAAGATDQQIERGAGDIFNQKKNGFNDLDEAWSDPKFLQLLVDKLKGGSRAEPPNKPEDPQFQDWEGYREPNQGPGAVPKQPEAQENRNYVAMGNRLAEITKKTIDPKDKTLNAEAQQLLRELEGFSKDKKPIPKEFQAKVEDLEKRTNQSLQPNQPESGRTPYLGGISLPQADQRTLEFKYRPGQKFLEPQPLGSAKLRGQLTPISAQEVPASAENQDYDYSRISARMTEVAVALKQADPKGLYDKRLATLYGELQDLANRRMPIPQAFKGRVEGLMQTVLKRKESSVNPAPYAAAGDRKEVQHQPDNLESVETDPAKLQAQIDRIQTKVLPDLNKYDANLRQEAFNQSAEYARLGEEYGKMEKKFLTGIASEDSATQGLRKDRLKSFENFRKSQEELAHSAQAVVSFEKKIQELQKRIDSASSSGEDRVILRGYMEVFQNLAKKEKAKLPELQTAMERDEAAYRKASAALKEKLGSNLNAAQIEIGKLEDGMIKNLNSRILLDKASRFLSGEGIEMRRQIKDIVLRRLAQLNSQLEDAQVRQLERERRSI
ncbi:MAG: hypothetical protein V1936_02895 [Patescibacteria group bacterium]